MDDQHIDDARQWMSNFIHWYNEIHQHSKIKFVTLAERHQGLDAEILLQRERLYSAAKLEKPHRWSGKNKIGIIYLGEK